MLSRALVVVLLLIGVGSEGRAQVPGGAPSRMVAPAQTGTMSKATSDSVAARAAADKAAAEAEAKAKAEAEAAKSPPAPAAK